MKVVVASGNAGKLAEFERLLAPLGFDCVAQGDLGVEDVEARRPHALGLVRAGLHPVVGLLERLGQ